MTDYSSIDYSSGFSQPFDVFTAPANAGGYDWSQSTPFSDPYQPSIQQNAPAQTNWTDILKGVGIAAGGVAKGIDAYRGTPSRPGNPFDQFMAQEAEKEKYTREKDLIGALLEEYTQGKDKKEQDPEGLLWLDRVLDPTKRTKVAGITSDSPRMAGSIFGMS